MKPFIIISYWVIVIFLLSTIIISLGYTFGESIFIGTIFLPGSLAVKFLFPKISFKKRKEGIKEIVLAIIGIITSEIALFLFAHRIISDIRSGSNEYLASELPSILINPIFIVVIIVALSVGSYYVSSWMKKKYPSKQNSISFSSDRQTITLNLNEILYIESNDFITIVVATENRKYRNRTSISQWTETLGKSFIRIHRSYIVNKQVITGIKGYLLLIGNTELPISRKYKEDVDNSLVPTNNLQIK